MWLIRRAELRERNRSGSWFAILSDSGTLQENEGHSRKNTLGRKGCILNYIPDILRLWSLWTTQTDLQDAGGEARWKETDSHW